MGQFILTCVMLLLSVGACTARDATEHSSLVLGARGRQLHQSPFRVLALGDSTTEGWVPALSSKKPYTTTLQSLLSSKLGRPVEVDNAGLGWAAVDAPNRPNFLSWARSKMSEAKSRGITYNWVVLWVGQNDISNDQSGWKTYQKLKPFLIELRRSGSNVLVVTPLAYPEMASQWNKEGQRKKYVTQLNRFVNGARKTLKKFGYKTTYKFLNLHKNGFNPYGMPASVAASKFNDWHLTEAGYQELGRLVFKNIA